MSDAVLLCCSLDTDVRLAPVLVELDRAGISAEVVSGVEEDVLALGRAIDRFDDHGVVLLVAEPSLPARVLRRVEGVFSARHRPGQTFGVFELDPAATPQETARRLLDRLRGRGSAPPFEEPRSPAAAHPAPAPRPTQSHEPTPPAPNRAAVELEQALAQVSAAVSQADAVRPAASGLRSPPPPEARVHAAARRTGPWVWIGAALAVVLVAGAVWVLHGRSSEDGVDVGGPVAAGAAVSHPAEGAGASAVVSEARSPATSPPAAGHGGRAPSAADRTAVPAAVGTGRAPGAAPATRPSPAEPAATGIERPHGGEPAPSEAAPPAARSLAYREREALVIARALAKGRLRAIDGLVVGVVDPTPRTHAQAEADCREALVAGVGNFALASVRSIRAVRRARMLAPGRYWTASPGAAPGTWKVLDTGRMGFAQEGGEARAGVVCVRSLPKP